ncbi:MAG: hydroxyacylglutathione hydrolase [Oceanicaulis sp.]|uniref:Hydroxyacylglutathione hydrolase n=1 Tax=Maricaulis virginensis TaxID=144022 RepID=A0A9W6MPY1_9PROT|nr:hydroxyacylglutathione hydrolase [Maricaulis virginensis]MAC38992.1 hydroxyacylglutathione hydrolase [Oceanicaulis sp.]MBI75700.1 hydroxyacylglutathione hydrolase [Oceanicaulis sp.]GLK53698.1 hydroxyacylglutathione hydrolase [Maricaulis virginensis]
MSDLLIRQFPCLSDNYGFLVHDPETGETATIDTPDADRILAEADAAGWRITQIWNTHHHFDHAGGNAAVRAATGARIIAPGYDAHRIPDIDVPVSDGDTVALGRHEARVLFTPGHTLGHVCYHFADDRIAFVGDTLFALGCGRLFEGSPEQMWTSLSRLAAWPEETRIYCAHEYTQANAAFALSVDPDNRDLQAYAAAVEAERARGEPTVPTTIGAELAANPFLRPADPAIRKRLGLEAADDATVFAEIRRRKDNF